MADDVMADDQVPVFRLEVTEVIAGLADIARQQPQHRIWAEQEPGRERLTYVAQRREGTDANPYLVVTDDLDELRDALRPE